MKAKIIKFTIYPTIAIIGLLFLSGCNTIEGVGEDMQDVGDAIEDEAQ